MDPCRRNIAERRRGLTTAWYGTVAESAHSGVSGGRVGAPQLKQDIRFCTSRDGTRIAYATMGQGPPLVRAAHTFTHLEFELNSPVWSPWLVELSRSNTLVRYDQRGCGLSDREVAEISLDAYVADLEAVVDAAGLERFALFGPSQGCAISIAYAARHPERVTRVAIYGGYARGFEKRNPTPEQMREWRAMLELVELGWGRENPAYRQMFTSQYIPDSTREQATWFNELERMSTTPAGAARIFSSWSQIDVTSLAPRVRCPALVLHTRGDVRIPFEEGRLLAGLLPDARFVPLESRNHVLLEGEPALAQLFAELHAFLREDGSQKSGDVPFPDLTPREREVLELVAHGLDNMQIAARLGLSEKTVRNNITPILDKLGVETRSQAIVRAREAGLASAPLPRAD
jgi:pimeloyl-ACP methyl ester carboxylesterase/DNA-binding CsgD family transcriptional regulator